MSVLEAHSLSRGIMTLDHNNDDFAKQVADALEHLWDYSYLGQHPLAQLNSVKRRLRHRSDVSHVDLGRATSEVLQEAIENLKPSNGQRDFSREKHFYTILTKAYLDGMENRTIAASLSIGERTLYRYNFKAIRVIAQILKDWEVQDRSSQ